MGETKMAKSGSKLGNIPKYKPEAERLASEIKKKYSMDEVKQIALNLLTHELIEEPPEIVEEYGAAMAEKARLEAKGISGFNYDERQAWIMVRDEYFKKVVDDGR